MRIRITVKTTGDWRKDLRVAANVRRDLCGISRWKSTRTTPWKGRTVTSRSVPTLSSRLLIRRKSGGCWKATPSTSRYRKDPRANRAGLPELRQRRRGRPPDGLPQLPFPGHLCLPDLQHRGAARRYARVSGDLFRCPHCHNQVRFRFNEPMFLGDGTYNQPLVLVEEV